jgi:uncharacterized membrane protein YdbT with pleckstrin-like domain
MNTLFALAFAFLSYVGFQVMGTHSKAHSDLADAATAVSELLDISPPINADMVAGVAAVVFALLAVWQFFKAGETELTVTDRRVIYKEGFIRRRVREIHLLHVDTIDIHQGFLGRIFGHGSIVIWSAGGQRIRPRRSFHGTLALRATILAQQVKNQEPN